MEMISKVHRYLQNQYLFWLKGHDQAARDELYVIFHKRVRVFYQGLQTRGDNENHEGAARVIFIVLEYFVEYNSQGI